MTLQDEVAELFALQGHVVRRIRRVGGFSYDLDIVSNKGERWIARCEDRPKLRAEHVTVFAKTVTDEHAVQATIITSGSIDPDAASFAKRANIQALDATRFRAYLSRARERSATPIPTPQSPPSPSEVRYPFDEAPNPTGIARTKRCPFCAEEILAAAVVCRFCGRDLATSTVRTPQMQTPPPRTQRKSRVPLLILLIVGACIILAALGSIMSPGSDQGTDTVGASEAQIMCRDIVKAQLVAPSTAKFPPYYEEKVWTLEKASGKYDAAFRVRSYVDAQNSFGATIRTTYTCDISYEGGEWTDLSSWTLLDLVTSP